MGWKTPLLVIVIGLVLAKMNKDVFLNLPMGFIPFAMLGGNIPPYFTYEAWKPAEFVTFTKPGDVVVSGGPKSGTNWMLYLNHLIRVKGDIEKYPFRDVLYATPWPTMLHEKGQTWKDVKQTMYSNQVRPHWDNEGYLHRVFKSHEVPIGDDKSLPGLPVYELPDRKYIAIARSPHDVLRSFYPFFANHRDDFREYWGGFPPVYDSKDQLLADCKPDGNLGPIIWPFYQAWWNVRNQPNVLLLHYDDALKDPAANLDKIANFVGVKLSQQEKDKILKLTSFTEMKKLTAFQYTPFTGPINGSMKPRTLVRSGKKGESKTFFTPEELAQIDSWLEQTVSDPELHSFIMNGYTG